MTAAARVIRWTTAGAVAGVAAVASCEHACALARAHGEAGRTGRLVPLTVDGLVYADSMVMLDSARRKVPVPPLARWLLEVGIAATLAADVARGLGRGLSGAVVAGWPAVALVGSYELLMVIIGSGQAPEGLTAGLATSGAGDDPAQTQAAEEFAGEVAARRVPSIRVMRARLHVGQPRAQRVRAYLAALVGAQQGQLRIKPARTAARVAAVMRGNLVAIAADSNHAELDVLRQVARLIAWRFYSEPVCSWVTAPKMNETMQAFRLSLISAWISAYVLS